MSMQLFRAWAVGPWLAVLTLALLAVASPTHARRVALLIGVGNYPSVRTLEGPAHDVRSMQDVLTRRWGFDARDVRTLVDRQATRAAILQELQALQTRTASGDEVLIYLSGHGSSALDSANSLPVPHGSGAFIPVDVDLSSADAMARSLIIGRRDLRPLLEPLDRGGRKTWVISDSCYSGRLARTSKLTAADLLPSRAVPLLNLPADIAEQERNFRLAADRPDIDPYPYKSTTYLSAAAEGELAKDIPASRLRATPTLDGKPHGAMTDALLRVLEGQLAADFNGDGLLDLTEAHRAVSDFMAERAYGHSPQRLPAVLEDSEGLGARPVLGERGRVLARSTQAAEPLRIKTVRLPDAWLRGAGSIADARTVVDGPFDIQVQPADRQGFDVVTATGDRVARVDAPAQLQAQLVQLALAKSLRQLAERHRRAALPLELTPSLFGGNFTIGQKVKFAVRPDRDAWVLLLNIAADGHITTQYPFHPHEAAAMRGGQARTLPTGAAIDVTEPLGMDYQLAFAFDSKPDGFDRWVGASQMAPQDERLAELQRLLVRMTGRFTFAPSELRVLAAVR
jgi:hypothetical protein